MVPLKEAFAVRILIGLLGRGMSCLLIGHAAGGSRWHLLITSTTRASSSSVSRDPEGKQSPSRNSFRRAA